jgi:trimethylamine--corrinoid protein Co-methyltransferase
MEQRISLITLGARDTEALAGFYEAIGWKRVDSPDGVIAFDLIGQALRCVRGIEVGDAELALEEIRTTCLGTDGSGKGVGHYLGTDQTLSLMESNYVYPTLGDRTSPKEWAEKDKPDLLENATAIKEKILSEPSTAELDPMLDKAIRDRFNIHLN